MPQHCSVCRNPQRDAINEALLTGGTLRAVAKRFGTSVTALHRHRKEIPRKLVKAAEVREIVLGDTLLAQVNALIGKATRILERAEASADDRSALMAVRETRETLRLLAQITGQLEPERSSPNPPPLFALPANAHVAITVEIPPHPASRQTTIDVTPEPPDESGKA